MRSYPRLCGPHTILLLANYLSPTPPHTWEIPPKYVAGKTHRTVLLFYYVRTHLYGFIVVQIYTKKIKKYMYKKKNASLLPQFVSGPVGTLESNVSGEFIAVLT